MTLNGWYRIEYEKDGVPPFEMKYFHEGEDLDGGNSIENYEAEGFRVEGPCLIFTQTELDLFVQMHLELDREMIFNTIKEIGEREREE